MFWCFLPARGRAGSSCFLFFVSISSHCGCPELPKPIDCLSNWIFSHPASNRLWVPSWKKHVNMDLTKCDSPLLFLSLLLPPVSAYFWSTCSAFFFLNIFSMVYNCYLRRVNLIQTNISAIIGTNTLWLKVLFYLLYTSCFINVLRTQFKNCIVCTWIVCILLSVHE